MEPKEKLSAVVMEALPKERWLVAGDAYELLVIFFSAFVA